ncbi:MAG: RNA-guided endonuclease IscB [Xenococcaceae cyanobacterium MO_167.B27]|nr:RNA-guided endonuclease IscB [Xenococcaceae cyanobacterium MO_167.B27]
MSNYVFVLDTNKQPLSPCTPGMARSLLKAGKAEVFKRYPFTIILKKTVNSYQLAFRNVTLKLAFQSADSKFNPRFARLNTKHENYTLDSKLVSKEIKPCQLKLDPGSVTTGIAILQDNKLIWAAELTHRGQKIKDDLECRRSLRRGRRGRKTRYRKPRFLNRKRSKGWLAPSLEHRVLTIMTWVNRLIKLCPINSIATELVRFDTQKLNNPEISGVEYQQGTLYQYEVRQYLLEKFNRTCAYCGVKDVPLEVEHIKPKSKGGSNRVSNLAIACVSCNQAKSNLNIKEFLFGKPSVLKRILAQAKAPLKDAAAVNSTRWKLFNTLKETGLPVTTGTGGKTKFNRSVQSLKKRHYLDAACVGDTPKLEILTTQPLLIKCAGHGKRQVIHVDKFGFPKRNKSGELVKKSALIKSIKGFRTGDIVKAIVPKGKKIDRGGCSRLESISNHGVGFYLGKVAIRSTGSFNIKTVTKTVQGINYKYCSIVHRKDGYLYGF